MGQHRMRPNGNRAAPGMTQRGRGSTKHILKKTRRRRTWSKENVAAHGAVIRERGGTGHSQKKMERHRRRPKRNAAAQYPV